MPSTIGEVSESPCKLEVEWRIPDFFSLSDEVDECYDSPAFAFAGESWFLRIFPNGESEREESAGCIGLYLWKESCGPEIGVSCTLGLKTAEGKSEVLSSLIGFYYQRKDDQGRGSSDALKRSEVMERKSELAPSDVITVTCELSHSAPKDLGISRFTRLLGVSASLKNILTEKKQTDVVLKTDEREFPAHRMILESRSPMFAAMFDSDMGEKGAGAVTICDIHPKAMDCVLSYMYSGEVEGISLDNVFEIYVAADKYDLRDLKQLCKIYIKQNLRVQRVPHVIAFAQLHKEEELEGLAREYFKENVKTVLETDEWKRFSEENAAFSTTLLTYTIQETV